MKVGGRNLRGKRGGGKKRKEIPKPIPVPERGGGGGRREKKNPPLLKKRKGARGKKKGEAGVLLFGPITKKKGKKRPGAFSISSLDWILPRDKEGEIPGKKT